MRKGCRKRRRLFSSEPCCAVEETDLLCETWWWARQHCIGEEPWALQGLMGARGSFPGLAARWQHSPLETQCAADRGRGTGEGRVLVIGEGTRNGRGGGKTEFPKLPSGPPGPAFCPSSQAAVTGVSQADAHPACLASTTPCLQPQTSNTHQPQDLKLS